MKWNLIIPSPYILCFNHILFILYSIMLYHSVEVILSCRGAKHEDEAGDPTA